jgi:quercetin dioxygenase-like cupin family protein
MKEKTGEIFSISNDNPTVKGCTVSKTIYSENGYDINYFSLAENTDISAETYEYPKICIVNSGEMEGVNVKGDIVWNAKSFEIIVCPQNEPIGMRTKTGCIYTEIAIRKESNMNEVLEAGKVLKLADLLPYQEGRIVNMDLINDPKLKFVIMSFDERTGLSEHSAPGEALIFALDGQGIIGYEGKEHTIKAGENFKFAKNGKHYVKADGKFKMALLLTLE